MSMDAIRRDDPDSLFATPAIVAERRADGATLVRSTMPLRPRVPRKWMTASRRTARILSALGIPRSFLSPSAVIPSNDAHMSSRLLTFRARIAGRPCRASPGTVYCPRPLATARAVAEPGAPCSRWSRRADARQPIPPTRKMLAYHITPKGGRQTR